MMDLSEITIKNYYCYNDVLKSCISNKEYKNAENILIKIIDIIENNSKHNGEGVAPGYYLDLSKIYKKTKRINEEIEILKRFCIQIKSRGQVPKKLLIKYTKLNPEKTEETIKEEIYIAYLENIENIVGNKIKCKCQACKKEIILIAPGDESLFGSCCPYCFESDIFSK